MKNVRPVRALIFDLDGTLVGAETQTDEAVTEHRAVVEAVAARNGARAGRLLRQHAAASRARMHKAAAIAGK
jgi:DNA-binding GntR family transcriptional regulator